MTTASTEPREPTTTTTKEQAHDERLRLPPGPPPRKGIVRTIRYYASFALDPIGSVRSRFDAYGDIYCAPNKDGQLFVLKHPDHMREVLSTKASSFSKAHSAVDPLSRVLGDGLFLSEGDNWKRQRRMLQPAFAPSRMAAYGEVMIEESRRTAATWSSMTGTEKELRLNDEMTALTLRIVSRTLFGHDVSPEDARTVADAMKAFQRSLVSRDFFPPWVPVPGRRAVTRGMTDLDRIVYRLIDERRRGDGGSGRTDLLQLLVDAVDGDQTSANAKSGLTSREVRDQLVTLFLAGHETTAQALTWTFYCLAQEREAERALHEELDAVLHGRPPTVRDLEALPYTELVMSEAMRLYPPVYAMARRAREDTQIGEWDVPCGSEVMLWTYLTHRDPRFYPEPEKFRPERFDNAHAASLPKFAYLPFGGGPRACIGKAFAMMEARLILATLAQRFRLRLAPDQRVSAGPRITLAPKYGMRMQVLPRALDTSA